MEPPKEKRDNLNPKYEYRAPRQEPPVVNVYNTNVIAGAVDRRNQTVFVVGLVAGIFGLWGLAHLMNGKVLSGILWLMFGPILAGFAIVAVSTITLGVGALFAIPLWIYLAYAQAKSGATIALN